MPAAVTAEAPGVLVATKLHVPVARETAVERPQLVDALSAGPERLKLIRAPAGWGKSTLAAAWAAADRRDFAWLSLDASDDDPRRFWNYVIAALRTVDPSLGASSLALLHAPGTDVQGDVLPALLNELALGAEPMVLVLDDYHLIGRSEIHDQLVYLVEHLGESLAVVLVTRVEPPFPLGRLRAQGDLLELETESLRFDPAEAESLLNRVLGLELAPEQVASLRRRTEGWPAGLYLAAISLRGAADRHHFVEQFAGDDRNIVDYLGAEVLAAQPPRVREVLLRTSILDGFCAGLVAAVAEIDGAAAMLRDIERADLFLVPLDSRREWYRYHHLFRQLLRHELSTATPEAVAELHLRAARWCLDAGLVAPAIEHTIAAGDPAAADLVAEHWAPALLEAAGDRVVDGWLTALGPKAVAADVRLCFARCFVALSYGRMEEVADWLAIAERAPLPAPFRDGITSVGGALACVRAAHRWERGDAGGALEAGREVLVEEGEGSPWRAIGAATIGLAHGAAGEWQRGRDWMLEYARLGRAFGQHLNEASGLGSAAVFEAERAEWSSAEQLASRSREVSSRHGIDEHWSSAGGNLAHGLVREHEGLLEDARAAVERAVELDRRGAGPVTTGWALLHLARIQVARGDRPAARTALREARVMVAAAPDPGILPERITAAERGLVTGARAAAPGEPLSERELEVLRLLATTLSQREIGARLFVSVNTVKTHAKSIFRKLEVSGRSAAVARARELGLI